MLSDNPRCWTTQYRDTQSNIDWARFAWTKYVDRSWDNSNTAYQVRINFQKIEATIGNQILALHNVILMRTPGCINWEKISEYHLLPLVPLLIPDHVRLIILHKGTKTPLPGPCFPSTLPVYTTSL